MNTIQINTNFLDFETKIVFQLMAMRVSEP